ncbi:MAG: hypothetical protein ACO1N0_00870 [Fluviicola sp.]
MISERIVLLAILTAGMYGISIYMDGGTFVFPFGLYKPGILLVAISLLIANRKKPGLPEITLIISGIALAASSIFVLQFFISDSEFEQNEKAVREFSAWMFLAFVLFFFFWQILLAIQDKTIFRWLQIANAIAMMLCLVMGTVYEVASREMFIWLIVPTTMWLFSVFLNRTPNPLHKSMAGLFGFVILSCWFSALFFGQDAILGNL